MRILVGALQRAATRVTGWQPARARATLDRLARLAPVPDGVRQWSEPVGGVPADWFEPPSWDGRDTFLHIHGGGYVLCSPTTHRIMISEIAVASGARGVGIDYRLAPEHPYPAALDDCEKAYEGLLGEGVAPADLVLSGDSAGGALVLALLMRLRDGGRPLPRAAVLLSPWLDLSTAITPGAGNPRFDYLSPHFLGRFAEYYLAGRDPKDPFVSPVYGDPRGLPPLLVQAGGAELLLDDIHRFAERAASLGVKVNLRVYEDMVHAFQGFTLFIPEARRAIGEIGAFIASTRPRLETG